jgi:hypothetical protein
LYLQDIRECPEGPALVAWSLLGIGATIGPI